MIESILRSFDVFVHYSLEFFFTINVYFSNYIILLSVITVNEISKNNIIIIFLQAFPVSVLVVCLPVSQQPGFHSIGAPPGSPVPNQIQKFIAQGKMTTI